MALTLVRSEGRNFKKEVIPLYRLNAETVARFKDIMIHRTRLLFYFMYHTSPLPRVALKFSCVYEAAMVLMVVGLFLVRYLYSSVSLLYT